MLQEIKISFDVEKKTIEKVEGTKDVSPVDLSKILISIALSSLNKIQLAPVKKILQPKLKVVGV